MEVLNNRVIEVNDLLSRFFNHDHDGDSMIALAIHSKQARQDALNNMFVKKITEFIHMDELLIDYEHETIYSSYMLSYEARKEFNRLIKTEDHEDLKELNNETIESINYDQFISLYNLFYKGGIPIAKINGKPISFFELIINKILGTIDLENKEILYTFEKYGLLKKKTLNKLTYDFYKKLEKKGRKEEFWDIIHIFNKFFLEAGTRLNAGIASFDYEDFAVHSEKIENYKNNLIQNEPFLAFHQNLILFEDYVMPEIENNEYNFLNTLYESGARLKSVQLLKAASNFGIPTDIYGRAFPINIKNALLDGLTPEEYFISGDSARLALAQRQDAIPKGGELQRKFFFGTGILKQEKEIDDCAQVKEVRYFETLIPNKDILKTLKYRWYLDEETGEEKLIQGDEENLIGKTIKLRSPITCGLPDYKVCKKCLGEKRPETANLGAPIGQFLSEAIIQSILRTHHFGGAFLADVDETLKTILKKVEIKAENDLTEIIGVEAEINYIEDYLNSKYKDGLELEKEESNGKMKLSIKVLSLPFSEDAVKLLRETTAIIDKNSSSIDMKQSFLKLAEISAYNGILNIYFELVLSLLFYDEDNILYRYSDKEPIKQLALKDVIENIDPKLTIFYNFSNKTIQKIFSTKNTFKVDHMYRDLIDIYK